MKQSNTRTVVATMALILVALACNVAIVSSAQKLKHKHKEKRFEPVVKERLADYAGRYVGIEPDYYLEVTADADGELSVRVQEGARSATLRDIRIEGARLKATRVYANGTTKAFEATFVNRILNGEIAFGVLVENLDIEYAGITFSRLFYRLAPAR
ncbi:MAG TPA: hypothetical protein VGW12_19505 [Pyrinomonadaceae bacterium]|nr:hypothetical protein [Pyrinomonadaceae bacterium]